MKKLKRNVDGITLIALVVTIIVLLILAGVTIAMLTGENGILKMATKATDEYKQVSEEEQQKLEELEWELDDLISENDNEPVPEGKYYSIRNGKEKTYYETLEKAYEASVDNGGKYRGGTIVVEKDVTENIEEPIIINKTITIDLRQNTMEINQGMLLIGGTLTITGNESSEMIGTGNDMKLLTVTNDANLTILGAPIISSTSHAILTASKTFYLDGLSPDIITGQSLGTVNIQGGYIISTERSGIGIKGAGDIFINNATVVGMNRNKNGLAISEGSSSNIVITGNSIIGNGLRNVGDKAACAISHDGTGDLTIKGNTIVTAGLYGSNAVGLYNPMTLTIEENVSLYSPGSRTILFLDSVLGSTLNINTRGVICSKKNVPIGITTNGSGVNWNIQSGIFASGVNDPLQQVKEYMENYPQEETQQNIDYYYFDAEDFKTLKKETVPNLYVVKIGVN